MIFNKDNSIMLSFICPIKKHSTVKMKGNKTKFNRKNASFIMQENDSD